MKKQTFLQGAFILMIAGLVNRILGFTLRIILVRLVGDEGLGLFQMVYPFFTTLLLICTAGFPIAIAKLIPEELAIENHQGAYNYLKVTLIIISLSSIVTTVIFTSSADLIANLIFNDKRTYYIILAIAPALIFSPLAAAFRGFFQGFQTMSPTAISQIVEQSNRFLATLIILNMISSLTIKYRAASIALGISVGELAGLITLVIIFIRHLYNSNYFSRIKEDKLKLNDSFLSILKNIIQMALPITAGKLVNSLMWSAEAILTPRQLRISGVNINEAAALYGQLSGMVEPVIFLPTVITIALTTSLVPNISNALAHNELNKINQTYHNVIKISTYIGLPVTTIFFLRGKEICSFLYSTPQAGPLLAVMGFSATFIYYYHVSSGVLNGLGKPQLGLINLSIGSVVKLIGIYYLVQKPEFGIYGAALGITLNYVVTCLLNFYTIKNIINYKLQIKQIILKPAFSSSLLLLVNPYFKRIIELIPFKINYRLEILLILSLMLSVYLIIMFAIKAITIDDIKRFKR